MLLHPPYFLTTGISPCIEVWDLASGDLLKTITDNYFSSLTCNGRFLCAPESQRNSALRNVDHFNRNTYRSQVILMDIHGKTFDPCFNLCTTEVTFQTSVIWSLQVGLSGRKFFC